MLKTLQIEIINPKAERILKELVVSPSVMRTQSHNGNKTVAKFNR